MRSSVALVLDLVYEISEEFRRKKLNIFGISDLDYADIR